MTACKPAVLREGASSCRGCRRQQPWSKALSRSAAEAGTPRGGAGNVQIRVMRPMAVEGSESRNGRCAGTRIVGGAPLHQEAA